MPRFRRYRVFLVFAIISVLAFFHFTGIRELGASTRNSYQSATEQKPVAAPAAPPAAPAPAPPAPPPQRPPEYFEPHGPNQKTSSASAKAEVTAVITTDKQGPGSTGKPTQLTKGIPPSPTIPAIRLPPQDPEPDSEFAPGGQGRLEVPDLDRNVRWEKQVEHFPVASSDLIPLPTGAPKGVPRIQFQFPEESAKAKAVREKRLALIKTSFKRSWDGYKAHAWGHDELKPVFGGSRDPFMGWGATLVDGLDTLWLMGFKQEFEEAVKAVQKIDFKTSPRKDIPVFETVIRYLGGLLGAYDISEGKYPELVEKAIELAEILMGAFDTPNRMPITYYMWAPTYASQPHRAGTRVVLAELGSLAVEFTRLAQLTNQNKYYDAIARITNELEKFQPNTTLPGLWPSYVDISGCRKIRLTDEIEEYDGAAKMPPVAPDSNVPPKGLRKREEPVPDSLKDTPPTVYETSPDSLKRSESSPFHKEVDCEPQGIKSPPFSRNDKYTLGALADSTYEYLPKMHLLIGGLNEQYQKMYKAAMDTTRKYMLFRPMLPDGRDALFHATVSATERVQSKDDLYYQYEGHHLGCFAGGMFALGAKLFGIDGDLNLAAKLTEGCVWAYNATNTGIMPEGFEMLPCPTLEPCKWNETQYYDRIDPYAEERELQVQTWLEQKAQLEEEQAAEKRENSAPETKPLAQLPKATGTRGDVKLARRHNAMPDDPSRIDPVIGDRILEILGPKPSFIPHKEFAEQRIKEERIPHGMTEIMSRKYILRPEAIESVFYMYRITGDESWREKGWTMFKAVERSTRTELGSSAIKDVTSEAPMFLNEMESFWLGETLKYFYLLFSAPDVISLDDYIFNTEAHPFKIPRKS